MNRRFAPRDVVHLDLADPLPGLESPPGRGVFAVFWRHGIPLGSVDLDPVRLPLTSAQLSDLATAAIEPAVWGHLFAPDAEECVVDPLPALGAVDAVAAPLEQLRTVVTLDDASAGDVSVIVCTRDRPADLRRCLDALLAMRPPAAEIVVVDNAPSDDATRRVVDALPGVRYVEEPRPGLDFARNTGIRHSRSDVIAFTDDDVIVESDWAARISRVFTDERVSAVCGLVLPFELDTAAQVTFEKHWSLGRRFTPTSYGAAWFRAHRARGVPVWEIGAGANMAFRRTALNRIGAFDPILGAGAAGCSDDSEMWYRLLAEGGRIRYEPTAVVHHRHRRSDDDLSFQLHQYMRGHAVALLLQFEQHRHWGNLRRLATTLPAFYTKLAARRLLEGVDPRTATLRREVAGLWSGCRYYATSRLRRPT